MYVPLPKRRPFEPMRTQFDHLLTPRIAHVLLSHPSTFPFTKYRCCMQSFTWQCLVIIMHRISVRCRDSAGNYILRKYLYSPDDSVRAKISKFRLPSDTFILSRPFCGTSYSDGEAHLQRLNSSTEITFADVPNLLISVS